MFSPLTKIACSLLALMPSAMGFSNPAINRGLAVDDDASPEWTYRFTGTAGEEPYGPDDWYLGYPDCAGDRQSPINLSASTGTSASLDDFSLEFMPTTCPSSELTFQSDFAVWQVYYNGCTNVPSLKWAGETYNLLQLHIHSPSEHLIGGAEYAADIHLVHVKADTTALELLVVGVFFDVSEYGHNVELEKVWNVLGTGASNTTEVFDSNIYEILPGNPSYSHFMGSLTTPPCTEGVKWIVMNEPSILGQRQIDEYRRAVAHYPGSKVSELGDTNRPVQALNGRNVIHVA